EHDPLPARRQLAVDRVGAERLRRRPLNRPAPRHGPTVTARPGGRPPATRGGVAGPRRAAPGRGGAAAARGAMAHGGGSCSPTLVSRAAPISVLELAHRDARELLAGGAP